MSDHWTKNRKLWIKSVSPFHEFESQVPYMMYWVASLIFGTKMPHEVTK